MSLFRLRKAEDPRIAPLRAELEACRRDVAELRELALHLEGDLALVRAAAACLAPGERPEALAQILHDLCYKPLNLACFYLVLLDHPDGTLRFPFYFEGGRARKHPSRTYNQPRGLTERAMDSRQPLYIRSAVEGAAVGNVLTAAEEATGLTPNSWYGVPLGAGEDRADPPFGLLSFQSFEQDAFPEARRRIMDTLAALMGLALAGGRGT
jgi:GAF domain-containing protein